MSVEVYEYFFNAFICELANVGLMACYNCSIRLMSLKLIPSE